VSLATTVDGSFRDPAGHVHKLNDRIFRTITKYGAPSFNRVLETGFLDGLVEEGVLVPFKMVEEPDILAHFPDAEYVLEHVPLRYISFPYEWSFSLLKQAALLHLDIAIKALDAGITLSDASSYNIQFIGPKPIFIDHLSFKPYVEREYWMGHRQFCEQFLNPLLLRSKLGVAHNAWFRGTQEGVSNEDLSLLLRLHHKLSLRILTHVVLPARMQRKATHKSIGEIKNIAERKGLPKSAYKGLLMQLRSWISSLEPKGGEVSTWGSYAEENTYAEIENRQKAAFIEKFTQSVQPDLLFDLGCNSGAFSEVALNAGAKQVVGFDFDQIAIEKAFRRAEEKSINLLPLFLDASNPSPKQGWQQTERPGFSERAKPDAILALAFEHHLAIGKNIPLPQVLGWIISLSPNGIIEFVHKGDPTIQSMLSMREDIFHNYSQTAFEDALLQHASIVETCKVTHDGRVLYWYKRS